MRSLLALAAMAAMAAAQDYAIRAVKNLQPVTTGHTTAHVPAIDDYFPMQNEYDPYPTVTLGNWLYFCAQVQNSRTALLRVDLTDDAAEPQVLANIDQESNYVCKGLTYDPAQNSLWFMTEWDSNQMLQLGRCYLTETGEVDGCNNYQRGFETQTATRVYGIGFRSVGREIILAGYVDKADAGTSYLEQLACMNLAMSDYQLIVVNAGDADANTRYWTVVGDEVVFSAVYKVGNNDYGRGIGKISKASDAPCDYTVTRLVAPPSDNGYSRDGYIFGQVAPNGHLVMRWPTKSTDNVWRYGYVSMNVRTGGLYPIYVPTGGQLDTSEFSVEGTIYGWLDEYLIFSAYTTSSDSSRVTGLFAARWNWASGGWERRIISDTGDEGNQVWQVNAGDIEGRVGNLLWYDEDKQVMTLSGNSKAGTLLTLDVSALMDGSLAADARLPPAYSPMDASYDKGSEPYSSNVEAGDWVFMAARVKQDPQTTDVCGDEYARAYAINVNTKEIIRLLEGYSSMNYFDAVMLPGLNAIALGFYAYHCDSGRYKVGIRIFNAASLALIGSVKMTSDEADRDAFSYGSLSKMVIVKGYLMFAWDRPDYSRFIAKWRLPTTTFDFETALNVAVASVGSKTPNYYTSWAPHAYPMVSTYLNYFVFTDGDTGCMSFMDPDSGNTIQPMFQQSGGSACAQWAEPIVNVPIGVNKVEALFFAVAPNNQGPYRTHVLTNNAGVFRKLHECECGNDAYSTAYISDGAGGVYFFSTSSAGNNVLVHWGGDINIPSTEVYEDTGNYWNMWYTFPEYVTNYYGEGKHAIAIYSRAKSSQDRSTYGFGEPRYNVFMLNLDSPQESGSVGLPVGYTYPPYDTDLGSSGYEVGDFLAVVGSTMIFTSRTWGTGKEPYIFNSQVDDAPRLLSNFNDYPITSYSPSTLTMLPPGDGLRKHAVLVARIETDMSSFRYLDAGVYPPSPSPSPSPSVTPSATPSTSFSATPTPSTSLSATPSTSYSASPSPSTSVAASASPSPSTSVAASTEPAASSEPSASGTPSTTASAAASLQPVAKVEVKIAVPPVTKADLTASGAGARLRAFVAAKSSLPVTNVRVVSLTYYNTTTRSVLLTINVPANDPINTAHSRLRRLQNEPSGPDVSLELAVEVLAATQQQANAASSALTSVLADPAALSNDADFTPFENALCNVNAVDCSNGVVLSSAVAVVSLVPVPAAEAKDDKVGPGVGGFFGAAAGLLLIAGLYYYFYYKPAKAGKVTTSGPDGAKMVVRHVNPAGAGEGKASFAPQAAAV